jgi:tetratricopeptide (TPR) repeat protein
MYLPSVPPFLLVGAGAARAWAAGGVARRATAVAGTVALTVLVILTVRQEAIWRSSIDLWTYTIRHEPTGAPLAYYNRGQAYVAAGALDRAIADYGSAIALNPRYREAVFNRGVVLDRIGDLPRAVVDYREAIRLDPSDPSVHNNLGVALARMERFPEAQAALSRAVELAPSRADAWFNLGLVEARLGSLDAAEADVRRACGLGMAQACQAIQPATDGRRP